MSHGSGGGVIGPIGPRGGVRQTGDPPGVAGRPRRLEIGEVGHRLEGPVDAMGVDIVAATRFGIEDGGQERGLLGGVEHLGGPVKEGASHPGVIGAPRSPPDDVDSRCSAPEPVEEGGVLRHKHDPRDQGDSLSLGPRRPALAVPPSENMTQALAHAGTRLKLVGQTYSHFATRGEQIVRCLGSTGQRASDRPRPVKQPMAGAGLAEQRVEQWSVCRRIGYDERHGPSEGGSSTSEGTIAQDGTRTTYRAAPVPSRIDLSRLRSLLLALRIMPAIIGAATLEKPDGSPRLRRLMRVALGEIADQV